MSAQTDARDDRGTHSIPKTVASVSDYEELARQRLSSQAWAYVIGGAADELTVRENSAAFSRILLRSRVMQDLSEGHTRIELFGCDFGFPILLAPVAFQKLVHADGELETAMAVSASGAGMIVSTQASVRMEDIAARTRVPLWFQLYMQPDRGITRELVRRAEKAGFRALIVTVDAPVNGLRNREQRASFSMPSGVEAVNLPRPAVSVKREKAQNGTLLLGSPLLAAAPTWRDIAWLKSETSLPLIIKGIMTPEDAMQAIGEGADGIVVSNHGGRILDTQPASIDVLPDIAGVVERRVPILLDGGIRRGSDVFKALALGASAVLIGRPYMFGLAVAGAAGVLHVINILRAELELTMALTGCRNVDAITASSLRR